MVVSFVKLILLAFVKLYGFHKSQLLVWFALLTGGVAVSLLLLFFGALSMPLVLSFPFVLLTDAPLGKTISV